MNMLHPCLALLACLLLVAGPARGAESDDTCSHFIDVLPVVITSQGTWCLRHDVSTALGFGNVISVQANNVTLDCNGFKIGGLAAGPSTQAIAINGPEATNATVRNCTIRGFWGGIFLSGGNALVEDNLLEGITFRGTEIGGGDQNLLRRNRVLDTGGCCIYAVAIWAYGDVIDNVVAGVATTQATGSQSVGIVLQGAGNVARGNRVSGVLGSTGGESVGIWALGQAQYFTGQQAVIDNLVSGPNDGQFFDPGPAVRGGGTGETFCRNNHVTGGWATAFADCHLVAGNVVYP